MSTMKCPKCGRTTNSAVCDWIPEDKGCYAAYVDDEWVAGCILENGPDDCKRKYVKENLVKEVES